ncbi:acyl-CoA reductase-like NAD-dependent aldehyde dehydrogenase [Rhodococcus rhodochrous J45]|uniref:Acyl-CoA reductase-like NAD-dependent aldehyde dehydrogenase n=1 Tax=Rhodococcus rhodochrous J45 TaxID=935266 RepID=A0A562ERY7_RHORH|nr:aldehyde dehydrogenase family protein [Rhodococcus rhodochrous]TWH24629.1 acyl-CoA reductase-like NAD-dependent aldehyde dehydrogenase [Rhodococcus rhodochrous J45]
MTHDFSRLFIDGAWVDSDGGEILDVHNPANGELVGRAPQATVSDVRRAIAAARRAFDEGPWPLMTPHERAQVMLRMADALDKRRAELVDLSIAEAGSTRALAEYLQVGIPLQHFRDMAERILPSFEFEKPVLPTIGQGIGQGVVLREPAGVAALISAYNFPLFLNIMKVAPALAAGCTAVLKPAPTTPLEALILGTIAEEAGLPPGVLNIVTGDTEAGRELTTSRDVDLVSFTGSDTVGRAVYEQAAPTLKKVVLELGGKSANIICEDADLAKVAESVIGNMVTHSGQGCSLFTRTLVHRSRYDELVAYVTAGLGTITVGDPADPSVMMGPLISEAQRTKVEKLIARGVEEGAKIAFGGGRPAGLDKGYFVEPTLFVDVDNSMDIAQKEFFGPVGVIIPFDDDDHAVRLANESEFGLGGSVFAADPARAYGIAKRIRTGFVSINGGGGGVTPHVPFGGYKQSGLGREWGAAGLDEYLETKAVTWSAASGG